MRTPCKPFCSGLLWHLQHLLGFLLLVACSFSGHVLLLLACPFQTSRVVWIPLCLPSLYNAVWSSIIVFMHVIPQFMSLVPFHIIIVPIFWNLLHPKLFLSYSVVPPSRLGDILGFFLTELYFSVVNLSLEKVRKNMSWECRIVRGFK